MGNAMQNERSLMEKIETRAQRSPQDFREDLAKMIEAGAYTPGQVYESRNIYPAGTETLGSTIK